MYSASARKLTWGPKWPWRLVLGVNFFGKGPIHNNCKCLVARYWYEGPVWRAPFMSKEQYKLLRHTWRSQWPRVCNALYANFKHGQPFGSFLMWENQYSKAKGWINIFSYVECVRSEDLSIWFSRRTVNNRYWSSTFWVARKEKLSCILNC